MSNTNKGKKTLYTVTIILGIIAAFSGAAIPLLYTFLPIEVTKSLLIVVGVSFGVVIFLSILRMLFAPQMLVKLAIFPVLFALTAAFYMIYNSNAHMFFLAALSIIPPEEYLAVSEDTSKMLSPVFMNLGIWISALPMVLYAGIKMLKLKKGVPKNLEKYISGKGIIVNITDTRTMINHYPVYKVQVEINNYGNLYVIEKEIIIPLHILHVFSINSVMNILIDPKNDKYIYISTQYGIF